MLHTVSSHTSPVAIPLVDCGGIPFAVSDSHCLTGPKRKPKVVSPKHYAFGCKKLSFSFFKGERPSLNFPLADTTGCTHAGEDIKRWWPLNREPCGLLKIWAKVAWNMASNTIRVAMWIIQMPFLWKWNASMRLGLWESCLSLAGTHPCSWNHLSSGDVVQWSDRLCHLSPWRHV